jgi:hypothetical protein
MWTMHITNSRDFSDGVAYLSASTSIRCFLVPSRRTDPALFLKSPLYTEFLQ